MEHPSMSVKPGMISAGLGLQLHPPCPLKRMCMHRCLLCMVYARMCIHCPCVQRQRQPQRLKSTSVTRLQSASLHGNVPEGRNKHLAMMKNHVRRATSWLKCIYACSHSLALLFIQLHHIMARRTWQSEAIHPCSRTVSQLCELALGQWPDVKAGLIIFMSPLPLLHGRCSSCGHFAGSEKKRAFFYALHQISCNQHLSTNMVDGDKRCI